MGKLHHSPVSLVAWLALSQAKPAGKRCSLFVLCSMSILTLGIAALHTAAMLFNGYCGHIQGLILRGVPHLSIVKYEAGERIGDGGLNSAESAWMMGRLRGMTETSGGLQVIHDNATLEIQGGPGRIQRRLTILGIGAGYGICPLPVLEPYISKLAEGKPPYSVVISSDVMPGVQVGSAITVETKSGAITATVVGIPASGVMPLNLIAMSQTAASELLEQDEPNALFIKLQDGCATSAAADQIRRRLKEGAPARFLFSFWEDTVEKVFGILAAFKALLFGMFSVLLLMAAIFCYASFEVAIVRRRKHLATLVALGLPPSAARSVFHVLGLCIGIVSSVLGIALSFVLVKGAGLLPISALLSASGLTRLPLDLRWLDLFVLVVMTSVFAWLAARLASRPLLRLDPAEEMRQ